MSFRHIVLTKLHDDVDDATRAQVVQLLLIKRHLNHLSLLMLILKLVSSFVMRPIGGLVTTSKIRL